MSKSSIRGLFRGYRIQYARVDEDWASSMREQDYIITEALQYPRPRIMKRQVSSFGQNITAAGLQVGACKIVMENKRNMNILSLIVIF